MKKIAFVCSWAPLEAINNVYKLYTPNNSGKWNNLQLSLIKDADVIIILDETDGKTMKYIKKHISNKLIILIQREEEIIRKISQKMIDGLNITHIISRENLFQCTTYSQFIGLSYDNLINLQYPNKTKMISCIVSKKNISDEHKKRVEFITNLSKRFPDMIDIYGSGWTKDDLGNNYKGELGGYHKLDNNEETTKKEGLVDYKYTIAIENSVEKNCFTEKFTDAISCWTIPVYHGCNEISSFFPLQSFIKIDITDHKKSFEIINNVLCGKYEYNDFTIKNISDSRNLILNDYNIFNVINSYVEHNDIKK